VPPKKTKPCSTCDGKGTVTKWRKTGGKWEKYEATCGTCKGTGETKLE
jgi:DnaJ-class molecular chaperone